ncbi:MAG: hypothetical protein ACYTE2_08080, partial [Planctomycetota bacterium]
MQRRDFLRTAALASPAMLAAGTAAAGAVAATRRLDDTVSAAPPPSTGRLRHSVCRWCYGGMSLEDLCVMAKAQGVAGIDLLSEHEWEVLHHRQRPLEHRSGLQSPREPRSPRRRKRAPAAPRGGGRHPQHDRVQRQPLRDGRC